MEGEISTRHLDWHGDCQCGDNFLFYHLIFSYLKINCRLFDKYNESVTTISKLVLYFVLFL